MGNWPINQADSGASFNCPPESQRFPSLLDNNLVYKLALMRLYNKWAGVVLNHGRCHSKNFSKDGAMQESCLRGKAHNVVQRKKAEKGKEKNAWHYYGTSQCISLFLFP